MIFLRHQNSNNPYRQSSGTQVNYNRYGTDLLRGQASTPTLAEPGIILASMGQLVAAVVANLIGGLLFFRVDQFIFTSQSLAAQPEVRGNITCMNCGKIAHGHLLYVPGTITGQTITYGRSGAECVPGKNRSSLRSGM